MKYCPFCFTELIDSAAFCSSCGKNLKFQIPSHQLLPGTVLHGKFILGAALGEGGFGITYIGKDLDLDIKVAVKEYFPNGYVSRSNTSSASVSFSSDAQHKSFFEKGRAQFIREARTLAKFSGVPGIVCVRDFFEENNTAYIVMEYLEGKTLKQLIKKNGLFRSDMILTILTPVMQSLKKVHSAGLIHRDISPDNILLTESGAVLLDFGAARDYSEAGVKSLSVFLKPGYAPEEQYRSKGNQGPWTDVYALCATIYKCITGKTPDDSTERLYNDRLKAPSQLGVKVDPIFERALMKGLAVVQKYRYKSIDELLDGFAGRDRSILGADYVPPAPQKSDTGAPVFVGKNNKLKKILIASAAAMLVIAGVVTAVILSRPDDDIEAEETDPDDPDDPDDPTVADQINWSFDEGSGTLSITGSGDMEDYEVDEYSVENFVTTTAPWGQYSSAVKNINIEKGITSIGASSFCGFKKLEKVKIPDSVTSIGNNAFMSCLTVKSISLPDGVKKIGDEAFASCIKLEGMTIPDSVTEIGNNVFRECELLKEVTLPDGLVKVGQEVFFNCYVLEKIVFPDSVTSIGSKAFQNCSALKSVTIPESVTLIDSYAFANCKALERVTYTGTKLQWENIDIKVGNNYLTDAKLSVKDSGSNEQPGWTYDQKTATLYISGKGKMEDYDYLQVDNTDKNIVPWNDFKSNVKNVIIEDGITYIGQNAFNGFESLESVKIPGSVQGIGESAFNGCFSLQSVEIPAGVTEIGRYAFYICTSLDSVTIPDSVTVIGMLAFGNDDSLKEISVGSKNNNYCSVDGVLFNKNKTVLIAYPSGKKNKIYSIPDGVVKIEDYAFLYCTYLVSVTVPDSVTSIGESAFSQCESLEMIGIPDSVTEIGAYAFRTCKALKSIEIPEGVALIGDYTFDSCYTLGSVSIPVSVKSIGSRAFNECYELKNVTYSGTKKQWGDIEIGLSNYDLLDATITAKDGTVE